MSLDLNQLVVESFEVGNPDDAATPATVYAPIISTDDVPFCQGTGHVC
jgi:hypothetical protein